MLVLTKTYIVQEIVTFSLHVSVPVELVCFVKVALQRCSHDGSAHSLLSLETYR